MGLCFGTSSHPPTSPSPPPQLPPPPGWTDLAGLIFSSLPSHRDRLSFLAVSSQWRLGALRQHPLPPAMPWLLTLSEPYVYQSLPDGEVRLVPDRWGSQLRCRGKLYPLVSKEELLVHEIRDKNTSHATDTTKKKHFPQC
uniref:F-box domain-containing protein n=1 Tax=Oryza meridionalis TaxID=40149 RepID=A0A0E0D561_9ORYZ